MIQIFLNAKYSLNEDVGVGKKKSPYKILEIFYQQKKIKYYKLFLHIENHWLLFISQKKKKKPNNSLYFR